MTDPNHAHQFDPNRRGLCKAYIGGGLPCMQPVDAPVHVRWNAQVDDDAGAQTTFKVVMTEDAYDATVELIRTDTNGADHSMAHVVFGSGEEARSAICQAFKFLMKVSR